MTALPSPNSDSPPSTPITRFHLTRLMQIWRSAGWPCKDGLEIDLLAAGLIHLHIAADGCETLRLTDEGIRMLAQARQRSVRALSLHDRLGQKFAAQLLASGRIVWTELSLRAVIDTVPMGDGVPPAATADAPANTAPAMAPLWADEDHAPAARAAANVWRMARPDLFSVRNTSVPAYLQPMVHEVKASRADLLSDLRHDAKRQAYQWLCEECYYVFPAGIAEPDEIPEHFGIWVLHGSVEDGRFELLRPARHNRCTLPFAVWMALCKATPLRGEEDPAQAHLGEAFAPAIDSHHSAP
ncbi:hypothetical protein QF021_001136 [Acidovorax delafieldii]|uniref:hypothetical protein n=1 Tax=Acidovorax delafieldii TaxID=47920 RepID=UPI00285BC6BF|nr:hypothetical protein [Acidovorax delafieldii]MDR6153047.1 hypothetical protein [Acidovorax delafieldii]